MTEHIPVLLKECIDALRVQPRGTYIDATFGGGGHTAAICMASANTARIFAFDADEQALDRAQTTPIKTKLKCEFELIHANYADMEEQLKARSLFQADGILFDLGTSSFQLGGSGKGFSFMHDEPLDMRFGKGSSKDGELGTITARDVVNEFSETTLADIIYAYAEERHSRRIAKAIVTARALVPIETTTQLASIIESAVHKRGPIHPATRTFQAIRIAVNNEIENVRRGIEAAYELLAPGARLAVISFHSLEDRVVKQFFLRQAEERNAIIITKKPIVPSDEECKRNPRSRSAKLRIIEKP